MNKQDFLAAIRENLNDMPEDDIATSLDYYEEMLNERMESGMTEEEAIRDMESVDEITSQILAERPLARVIKENIKEKMKPSRTLKVWEIVLIVLGSPLWISLLAAGLAILLALVIVALSLYMVAWTLVGVLWIVMASIGLSAVAAIGAGFACLFTGKGMMALLCFGTGLLCAGLAILMYFLALLATKGLAKGTAGLWRVIFGKRNK